MTDAAPAAPAVPAAPSADSPVGRWYRSLPGGECYTNLPESTPGYQVAVPIGPEVDAFLGYPRESRHPGAPLSTFTVAPLNKPFTQLGAIYDSAHKIGLFYEFGQDRLSTRVIANAGAPPVAVKERDLSALAMGGKVHLGDTLENVRAAFSVPSALPRTTVSACGFPRATADSALIFYGPPHHPPVPARNNNCRDVGQDIKSAQTLGIIVFRARRVVLMEWDYIACGYP
jgi:hypothetical protein